MQLRSAISAAFPAGLAVLEHVPENDARFSEKIML
jgi:hypothetical protein